MKLYQWCMVQSDEIINTLLIINIFGRLVLLLLSNQIYSEKFLFWSKHFMLYKLHSHSAMSNCYFGQVDGWVK